MSSYLVKNARASSSRTERHETPASLHEETPQTNTPNETTSASAVEVGREPVFKGSKLFRVKTGTDAGQYLYLSHDPMEKKKSAKEQENKRTIYDGFYNCDVPVAILKIQSSTTRKELDRECRILNELNVHENFIRYLAHERDENFEYIATERCLCSIADLLDPDLKKEIPKKKDILEELDAKEILRQATRGLHYLHENNFVHRNIKPNNFLIKEINEKGDSSRRFVVKITDFRLTRKYDPNKKTALSGTAASEGWEAPESKDETKDLSTKLDVFILGCFYHYVVTALPVTDRVNEGKPRHPFGDANSRRTNICDSNHAVYKGKLDFVPNKKDKDEVAVEGLIKSMLKFNEDERPSLYEVLESSYFKSSEDYKIYKQHAKPGLCVIFNQDEFKDPRQNREGSDKDRDALKDTFQKLGFDIKVHESLNSDELKSEINELASENDFKSYGCLVVCFLSHGIENAIMCHDGKFVNTNKLKYEFSLNNCPSLYGKPKIFIVQSCQGELKQQQTEIVAPDPPNSAPSTAHSRYSFLSKLRSFPRVTYLHFTEQQTQSSPSIVQLTSEEVKFNYYQKELREMKIWTNARRNPPLMDFLTINAALPGFVSIRNWFIQALCEALTDEYLEEKTRKSTSHQDLEDLLRCVQNKINKKSQLADHRYEQTMQWEACLSKNIRFRKGEKEGTVL